MLVHGMVYMGQPIMATDGITFRVSETLNPSVVLWLLVTAYTLAP